MRALVLAGITGAVACGSNTTALQKAGQPGDEGDGLLGKLSMSMVTAEGGSDDEGDPLGDRNQYGGGGGGGYDDTADPDEPVAFGGDAYGGRGYAGFYVRPWSIVTPDRTPSYKQQQYLKGAIEGTARWTGTAPPAVTTACGPVTAAQVGTDRGVAGVVVYIESVEVGRQITGEEERVLNVGGTVAKRGCSFVPASQVMAPVPAAITVHADTRPTHARIVTNQGEPKLFDIEAGSRAGASVDAPGWSRVDSEDGTLGAAFVVGLSTTYYAVTDERGHFRIDELAAGTYDLTIWQPPVPKLTAGKLVYGAPTVTHRKVTVNASRPAHLDLSITR